LRDQSGVVSRWGISLSYTTLTFGFGPRKGVKASKSLFWFALLTAVGMSIQFFLTVWNIPESVRPASLLFYWCLWLLLPITLFGISALLKKDGR
jgi:hypothetical protein